MRAPIPLTKYNKETGHKHGMAAGRYLVSTCTEILKLLKSAESNAQFKGMSAANLVVKHIAAQDGPRTPRFGRQGRRKSKRAHVEIILSEGKPVQKAKVEKKPVATAPAAEKKTAPAKSVAAAPKQEAKKQ
jgi:ribosomal protein L22